MNPIIAYETAKDALEKADQALNKANNTTAENFYDVSPTEPLDKTKLWMEVIE